MSEILYVRDLGCYQNAPEEIKKKYESSASRRFKLFKLKGEIASQVEEFTRYRGNELSLSSIHVDIYPFNLFCSFINDMCPSLNSLYEISESELIAKAKAWLLMNGKKLFTERNSVYSSNKERRESDLISYIRCLYKFLYPIDESFCFENDQWYIKSIPINIKTNPTSSIRSISFEKISQKNIRREVKEAIYIHLANSALGTVLLEMTAINRFSSFLSSRYPEIDSLNYVDREVFERYLVHTNTEATGKKSYCRELGHLKSVLVTAGKILENRELETLFYQDDIGRQSVRIFKVYSDAEIKRLNAAIVEGDEQVARVLFIHQLLGTRISETLTLKQDAIFTDENGKLFIHIWQNKTDKRNDKPINDDIKKLFDKACEYTNRRYGNCEYVFVNQKDPRKPMTYGKIKYHIMSMVRKKDLRDDSGELFGVGTHIWRHCFGKKLTELHVDDATIAKLLGHANLSSLKCYRKIGNEKLAEETREMRNGMDILLKEIISEW